MSGYYQERLRAERLVRCYDVAPARVRHYLEAEILYARERIRPGDRVVELGCGYGRVTLRLADVAALVVGIDSAHASVRLARSRGQGIRNARFLTMDALALAFPDGCFDMVACVQNGICAFRVNQEAVLQEAARVLAPNGRLLFSTYAEAFWPHRLEWFERQAAAGLVGEIDRDRTGEGVIVCKDGFRVGLLQPAEGRALCRRVGLACTVREVDGSSVFFEATRPQAEHDR